MSTNTVGLVSSVKTRVAAVLGGTYSELAYTNDIKKNSFKGTFKRYGVISLSSREVEGILRYTTIEQTFEVTLVDSFINQSMTDAQELAKGPILHDLLLDIYKDLVSTRVGSNASVIQVMGFSANEPETIEGPAVIVKGQFTIKYRVAL